MRHPLLAIFLLMALSACAFAQVSPAPSLMNFQGRLTKPDGTPVADGTYSIRFSLHDAANGGSEKWSQVLNPVTIKNGTFSVLLDVATANLFTGNLFLEMKIGSDAPLAPRQQIVSVAYAMKANTVPDSSIGTNQLANDAVNAAKLLSEAASLSKVSAGALSLTSNRLFVPNGVIQRGGSAVTGTTDLGLYSQLNANWMRFVTNAAPFKWFSDSGAGTTPIMTLTQGGALAIGSGDPGMSLEVTKPTYYNAPALGASNGNSYSYLHVSAGDHSLIWNSAAAMRFGTETGRGTGYVERMRISPNGAVGVGTPTPADQLHLLSAGSNRLFVESTGAGYAGMRAKTANREYFYGVITSRPDWAVYDNSAGAERLTIAANGNVGIGNAAPAVKLDVNGTARTRILEVTGGSDVAEPYHVAAFGNVKALPGMVVAIDPQQVGRMRVTGKAYDKTVAGIISGANGIQPGITLRQEGTVADGDLPVASIGRVWCWCDADANGPIEAGDRLTTAKTPGHAMRVTNSAKADGAIIGKAMSSLKSGKGLVLVLVSLK